MHDLSNGLAFPDCNNFKYFLMNRYFNVAGSNSNRFWQQQLPVTGAAKCRNWCCQLHQNDNSSKHIENHLDSKMPFHCLNHA